MYSGLMHPIILFCLLILFPVAMAQAQEEDAVGKVERILERRGEDLPETRYAQIRRHTLGGWNPARRADMLYDQNIVRLLRNHVFVDLDLTDFRAVLGSRRLEDVGSYLIRADTTAPLEALSRLELVIQQGVMAVEDVKRTLMVIAAGTRVRIDSTTVLFQVDESGNEGTVFLREGSISFPDFNIPASGTNRAWRLQSGQPPVELILAAGALRQWQREVKYNTGSVWQKRPFWQQPRFYVPAAIALVGGIIAIVVDGPGTAEGTVIVTIPD